MPSFSREKRAAAGVLLFLPQCCSLCAPSFLICLFPLPLRFRFLETGYLGARELELVTVWVAFYGLSLLSTALSPRSLVILGWAFLLTAVSIPVLMNAIDDLTDDVPDTVMGVSFGLYHLIYAVATWPRRNRAGGEPITIE